MLKALGVEKKEIRGLYFSKYVMISACGALAGLIAAAALEALFSQQNLIPQNLRSTISSPEFVTYMGIGDGEIRMDVRQAEDIEQAVEQIAAALEQDEEVAQYSVRRTKAYPAILPKGESINLMVEAGKHSIFPVSISAGTLPEGEHDIALSALNAEELGLSVGDSLTLLVDDTETSYRISGIYADITNGGKTAKINNVQDDRSKIQRIPLPVYRRSGPGCFLTRKGIHPAER